jgi:hypothetical protein
MPRKRPSALRPTPLTLALVAALGLGAIAAHAQPLPQARLVQVMDKAYAHWKSSLRANGLVGLQAEIADCYRKLEARPDQAQAAFCAALDHYSLVDAMNFPKDLVPPYFKTDAVFARLDKAVAQSTPPGDRKEFTRRFLVEADEAIRRKK